MPTVRMKFNLPKENMEWAEYQMGPDALIVLRNIMEKLNKVLDNDLGIEIKERRKYYDEIQKMVCDCLDERGVNLY